MPRYYAHLARADENEKLALGLNRSLGFCVDWAITMLFYAALHRIDAYLAGKHKHPFNHKDRDDEIKRSGSISAIFVDYRWLKDRSRAARYEIANFDKGTLEIARAKLQGIKTHLDGL